jgi:uncharacterized protein (DUF2062 family)
MRPDLMEKSDKTVIEVRATPIARLRGWLMGTHTRLITIEDTPHSISLGSAVGIFMGFTPLYGIKTLLSFGTAWVLKSNRIAAVICVTLHDLILPFAPALYWWEYKIGFWAMHGRFPLRRGFRHVPLRDYVQWTTFFTVGQPLLIGSLLIGVPCGVVAYFVCRMLVLGARKTHLTRDPLVQ